jgi:rare lipoprotein A
MITMRAKMITVGLLGAAATVPIDFAKADQLGHASWYSLPANTTANGEQMNPNDLTAAHRSLPFGTRVLVENLSNGRSVVVRINDRGPFIGGRIIDLSKAAAASIGMIAAGTAKVRVITDGGVLAALGQSTAKTKNGASVAAAPETAIVSSKMNASLAEETKADRARPKSLAKMAKAAPKPSKTKGLAAVIASGSNKRDGAQARVKMAAVANRSKPGGTAKTRIHVAAVAKRSKPSGSAKTRIQLAAVAKRSKPTGSAKTRVHVADASNGIHAAGKQASRFSSRRITVASNTPHPYAVLGTTPGFMKPARAHERRTG